MLRQIPAQRQAQSLPRERIAHNRDQAVRELVGYAVESVPHFRELFARAALDPRDIRGAADLERLPLVEKTLVQADPARFLSTSEAARDAIEFRTGGTTAMPLTVYHDRSSLIANIAYGERERAVERAFTGRGYRYPVLDVRPMTGTIVRVQDFYADALFRPLRPRRQLVPVDRAPEDVLAAIERLRPSVLRGHGAHLELLFRLAADGVGLTHRPRAIVYAGDTMSDDGREFIESEFGIPVLSVYGAVECFKIGFTCEERVGFHLHEDLVHVMLVDPNGERVPAGERGEVVVSNLVNRGTVLINYRLGDLATLTDEPCACGRTSRRLIDLAGRVNEVLELEDGTLVDPTAVVHALRGCTGMRQFQLVQRRRTDFELRVVVDETEEADRSLAEGTLRLRAVLHGAAIEVVRMREFERTAAGKFRPIVPLEPIAP